MGRVAYFLAGEGRGHATRARTVVQELLNNGHEVSIQTGDDGYQFLVECFCDTEGVAFFEMPVLHFIYKKRGKMKKVSPWKTFLAAARFYWKMGGEVKRLAECLGSFEPDVFITDFEPLAWRVARRLGKPVLTLDNQHFFRYVKHSQLPLYQWPFTWLIGLICALMCPSERAMLISKYVPDSYVRPRANLHMIGPLIRPEVKRFEASEEVGSGGFALAYLRPSIADEVLKCLHASGRRVRVYGLGERPADGNVSFEKTSGEGFARDLILSECVVASAGNQSIGECLYLRKPLFLIPEPGQMEQQINVTLARRFGAKGGTRHLCREMQRWLENPQPTSFPFVEEGPHIAVGYIEQYLPPVV